MFESFYRRRVHHSWLVAMLCFGIVLGIVAGIRVQLPISFLEVLIVALFIIFLGCNIRKTYILPAVVFAGFLLGAVRGNMYLSQLSLFEGLIGQNVSITGKVFDDSEVGKRGGIVLRLSEVSINGRETGGSVWLTIKGNPEVKRGDSVIVAGKMSEGFGSFAASMHRAELLKIQRHKQESPALYIRNAFSGAVRDSIPEPEASLGIGYVVGERRSLPEDLGAALAAAGLMHVVVASGYNLTILVNASRRLFARVSKYLATFFSGGMIVSFMAITGMSPSMSRAGLVAGLGLIAWYFGRRFHPVCLLLLAAAITLLINPSYGAGDLGWQLSFASFAGVLIIAPLLHNYFFGESKPGIMRQIFFETLSAWVCTVPLIVLAFERISNVAILANLLILPLVPVAMILTFLAGVITAVLPDFAGIIGLPAQVILSYMTAVASFLGNVRWAETTVEWGGHIAAAYYACLVGICGLIWRRTRYRFIESK